MHLPVMSYSLVSVSAMVYANHKALNRSWVGNKECIDGTVSIVRFDRRCRQFLVVTMEETPINFPI